MGPILSQYNPVSTHTPFLWASIVGIATRFGLNVPRDRNPVGGGIFCTRPDRPWGPPSLPYNGYRVTFPGVKRPGLAIKQLPPPKLTPRLEIEYSNTSTPPRGLHGLSKGELWPLHLPHFFNTVLPAPYLQAAFRSGFPTKVLSHCSRCPIYVHALSTSTYNHSIIIIFRKD